MANETAALRLDLPRSLSDRPWPVRAAVHTQRFILQKKLGAFGALLVLLAACMALFAPWVERYSPDEFFETPNPEYDVNVTDSNDPRFYPTIAEQLEGPSSKHWLGTDEASRDLWARVVHGARLSLFIGVGAAIIATVVGTFLGVISGYFLGWFDTTLQRFIDAIQAFPPLILLLLLVSATGPSRTWSMVALGFLGIAAVTRIVRGSVLAARNEMYVEAARTLGAGDNRIMLRHVVPNIMAPIIVIFTISIGNYILAEASLHFLGLGVPEPSWGQMVNDGRRYLTQAPHYSIVGGVAITLTVLGFNLAGDALRDVLDPRLRGARG
jgi:peptide/nickel transport system permease protein